MEAMSNGRRIEYTAIAGHPLFAKARDASARYTAVRFRSPLVRTGTNNGILLGRFLETTVKNCYLISAFAIPAQGGALAQRDFLGFGA
jgi:hypothetical protein